MLAKLTIYMWIGHALFLIGSAYADGTKCASDAARHANGRALMQNVMFAKRGAPLASANNNVENAISQSQTSVSGTANCSSLGGTAPLSQAGYEEVKMECCALSMTEFIKRVVADSNFVICNDGFAPGLALWHTCDAAGMSRTYADLKKEINDNSIDRCTVLQKALPCKDLPADCPSFVGPAPSCGCARSRLANIDFTSATVSQSNLGGIGPSSGVEEFRLGNVVTLGTPAKTLDLVITNKGGNYSGNGRANKLDGDFFNLHMQAGCVADLTFSFVETGTSNLVTIPEFAMTVFDLDGSKGKIRPGGGPKFYEQVMIKDFASVVLEPNSLVTESKAPDGRAAFEQGVRSVPNPSASMTMTSEQRQASVMFIFKNTASFDITLAIAPGESPSPAGFGRNFIFAGASALCDRCSA